MSVKRAKSDKLPRKLEIRCNDIETRRGFKRIAADFETYEHALAWLVKNYDVFKKIAPPYPTPGGVL